MKIAPLVAACLLFTAVQSIAQTPTRADVWGVTPTARDDRYSNPKSKLYSGPDGWYNTGEVRATAGSATYNFRATFDTISGQHLAVKDLQVLLFDFGSEARPKPGVYKIGSKGDPAQKTVKLSFADTSNQQIKEWRTADGAGTLTVTLINGFTHVTTRNVPMVPQDSISKGNEWKKPMTLGFEGAMAPE